MEKKGILPNLSAVEAVKGIEIFLDEIEKRIEVIKGLWNNSPVKIDNTVFCVLIENEIDSFNKLLKDAKKVSSFVNRRKINKK